MTLEEARQISEKLVDKYGQDIGPFKDYRDKGYKIWRLAIWNGSVPVKVFDSEEECVAYLEK